jgi:hypothetical protein
LIKTQIGLDAFRLWAPPVALAPVDLNTWKQ